MRAGSSLASDAAVLGLWLFVINTLDEFDEIYIQGVSTSQLSYGLVNHESRLGETLSGIGIYASGALEAVYVGDNLNMNQIEAMTQGLTSW